MIHSDHFDSDICKLECVTHGKSKENLVSNHMWPVYYCMYRDVVITSNIELKLWYHS